MDSYTQYIQYFSLLIGFGACSIGLLAIAKPQFMSEGFGIKVSGAATSYVVALGIRDLFIGLTVLLLYSYQAWVLIGYTSLMIAMVAFSDFLVVFKNGKKSASFVHLLGLMVALAYGLVLLTST